MNNFCKKTDSKWKCTARSLLTQESCAYYSKGDFWCKFNENSKRQVDAICRSPRARQNSE